MNGRTSRNALAGAVQTVVSAGLMFAFYRVVLQEVGADGLGLWSVVLASLSAARVSELGLSGSAVKYTAARIAQGDPDAASRVVETTVLTVGGVMAVAAGLAYLVLGSLLPTFVPASGLEAARALLPYACVSFWLTSVGGAFQSGLDGCGRIDLRNAIALASQVIYVALGVWWVREGGLVGLALAQIVQGAVLGVAVWGGVRHALPTAPLLPWRWDGELFREMLRYGLSFQALSLLRMLFEPTTKVLMSAFGGLAAAGFYEMATLLVTKLRALVIAAQQALTPQIAYLHERAPERVDAVYDRVNGVSAYVTVPLFCGLAVAAPLASHLWIGAYEPAFVLFVDVLAAGWLVNTLSGPAFFLLLGTGEMGGVVWSHVTTAVLNAVLGAVLGWRWGAVGVAVGWAFALAAGAAHLIAALYRDRGLAPQWPAHATVGLVAPLLVAAVGAVLVRPESLAASAAVALVAAAVLGALAWVSPYRSEVLGLLRGAVSPGR